MTVGEGCGWKTCDDGGRCYVNNGDVCHCGGCDLTDLICLMILKFSALSYPNEVVYGGYQVVYRFHSHYQHTNLLSASCCVNYAAKYGPSDVNDLSDATDRNDQTAENAECQLAVPRRGC